MKSSAGLLIIIFALFALWSYNTGRAAAILAVIKNPTNNATGNVTAVNVPGVVSGIINKLPGGTFTPTNIIPIAPGMPNGTLPGINYPTSSSKCVSPYDPTCIDNAYGIH